jgi:catalase
MVDGIGPSPDRMLQARLFAYGDAHRYRVGINHTRLAVNAPRGTVGGAQNYGCDGSMRFDDNGGRTPNYEPNSFDTPAETGARSDVGFAVSGATGVYTPVRHAEDDDFVQAGNLYRVMTEDERTRLVANIAGSLSQVTRRDIIQRSIAHFAAADKQYGERIAEAIATVKAREASGHGNR